MDKTVFAFKQQWIDDFAAGEDVDGLFLLASATQQQARNGPFWRLELKDATGSIEARIWSPASQAYTELRAGLIAQVEGRAESFREQLQVNVTRLRLMSAEELSDLPMAAFLPASARAPQAMFDELEALCRREFTHKPWRAFALALLGDEDIRGRLLFAPAAKGVHHAFVGGLLEHTLGVVKICLSLADLYPELDRQTLLAGALCHDLGKIWELSGGLTNDYTDAGRLVGHINLCLLRLEQPLRKSGLDPALALHLQHLILSHHGLLEYGSPKLPQTVEAMVLHYADNIDAKLGQCRALFDPEADQPAWSSYQNTLSRQIYLAPRSPDAAPKTPRSPEPAKVEQCSLLSKE